MRTKLLAILAGCGLVAATIAPALACNYQTNASNEQATPQQDRSGADPGSAPGGDAFELIGPFEVVLNPVTLRAL